MTDTSEAELPPQTNGITDDGLLLDDGERLKMRPADIDADVREMERRKRVENIMNSRLFREELERIIETQLRDGTGTSGLLQQISDMVGVNKQAGNVFKNASCVVPINDIRGIEAMGYAKGEKILRCKLACVFRLIDLSGWTQGSNTLITARLNQEDEQFLVNPYGMLFHEITASSLIKVDMQGGVIEQGTTNFPVNIAAYSLHAAVHAARPDLRCIIQVNTPSVVAVSALKYGLLPLSQESVVVGEISTHTSAGGLLDPEEKDKLARNLGPNNKVLLLTNQGALCCGETIEEAFFNARNTVLASESQLKLLPVGLDNLVLLTDETRKKLYEAAHKAPESSPRPDQPSILEGKVERKWRVGGVEFEALMRMLDNAGFRTGYIYRNPLVKGEPPKPKNDVELPPAVSSLGYLLEEEELYRQGLWKKLESGKKGQDRSRWLNSPNVYQKVEILETGTPDPKKITKWVAEGSPTHSSSTPVKIESALQFVPKGTNPKEFKQKQQQIKDYRRADKISAGPQSHILEGVTWEEAKKMQDASVTQTGDHVVLMGAASKGIIQRGHQHNATVYKSPYAKNPFDSVTDEELDEYKKVVERKTKGEYDTDFSESEGLSSAQINRRIDGLHIRSPTSETEEESRDEPQILRIETRQAPKPSQPEVVLSDDTVYRSSNYAGLPKGSYLIPNPIHFHIARHMQLNRMMRPQIISFPFSTNPTNYLYNNQRRYFNIPTTTTRQSSSLIKINLADLQTISLNIDTVMKFICPFVNGLNLIQTPFFNNQASQTAFVNDDGNYTPLSIDSNNKDSFNCNIEETAFEQEILTKLHDNLVFDLSGDNNSLESDQTCNEGLIDDLSPNTTQILENLCNSSDESEKIQEINNSVDEGFDNTTFTLDNTENQSKVDEKLIKISTPIYEYIFKQCFELKELILFPEVLHDPNFVKLLDELKCLYMQLYGNDLSCEEKNDLRISVGEFIMNSVIRRFDKDISNDSILNNSDKLFSTSEFLSDILDHFFIALDCVGTNCEENFTEFRTTLEASQNLNSTQNDDIVITSFKKTENDKTGAESFWFTIVESPVRDSDIKTSPVDFDEIPIPVKHNNRFVNHTLSPIPEESRLRLFDSDDSSECPDIPCDSDTYIAYEEPEINVVVCKNFNFCRTTTVNSCAYVKSDRVTFNRDVLKSVNHTMEKNNEKLGNFSNGKENRGFIELAEDEGDWMGFDLAKF